MAPGPTSSASMGSASSSFSASFKASFTTASVDFAFPFLLSPAKAPLTPVLLPLADMPFASFCNHVTLKSHKFAPYAYLRTACQNPKICLLIIIVTPKAICVLLK